MRTDFNSNMDFAISLNIAAYTATTNGAGVDVSNYGEVEILIAPGTRTDGTHTPKVQESPDNSTWADVAAADLVGTALAAIASNTVQRVGYIGSKRYLRVVTTVAGATTGAIYGGVIARGGARKQALA